MKRTVIVTIAILLVTARVYGINEEGNERGSTLAQRFAPKHVLAQEALDSYLDHVDATIAHGPLPEGRHYVRKVVVENAERLGWLTRWWITRPWRRRELTSADILACAHRLTRAYRENGYLSSYAVFERLEKKRLYLRIHEGRIGTISFKGNLYSPEPVLRKRFAVDEDEVLYLPDLQYGTFKIGRHMDRKARMRLHLNKETNRTDINLALRERPPAHITAEVDTYGSYYIGNTRYRIMSLLNNVSGNDDALQVKMQWADDSAHELLDIAYRRPLGNRWMWEAYYMPYKAEDYINDPLTGVHKRAWKAYTYLHYTAVERPGVTFVGDLGFVHKHIDWERPVGNKVKWDYFSGLLLGFDLDIRDRWGRTIIIDDYELGIPDFLGSVEEGFENASVEGADGKYQRNHLIVARRQRLFEGTDVLLKGHWQWADRTLTGVNAFSVGGYFGIIDMRGYPRAQAYGENGYSLSAGIACAPYFLPHGLKVPFSKATFRNSTQLFAVVDWATVEKLEPPGTEDLEPTTIEDTEALTTTLASGSVGLQMMLPEQFMMRLEVGWPLTDIDPKDDKDVQTWLRISKTF